MNRLYAVEPSPSMTGGRADHRFTLKAKEIPAFAARLAAGVGVHGYTTEANSPDPSWFGALVQDLHTHRGASVVIAGDWQPPEVHAIVHQINVELGNFGQAVIATDPLVAVPTDSFASLRELVTEMNAGQVELLVIGGNPVYDAPEDLAFTAGLKKVQASVHLAQFDDETSLLCDWHIPEAHPFDTGVMAVLMTVRPLSYSR